MYISHLKVTGCLLARSGTTRSSAATRLVIVLLTCFDTSALGAEPEALYDLGAQRLADREYEAAAKFFGEVLRTTRSTSPRRCKGFADILSGDPRSAVEDFTKAIELSPKDSVLYYGRGCADYFLGNGREAIDDLGQSIKLNPTYSAPFIVRWEVYSEKRLIPHDRDEYPDEPPGRFPRITLIWP